VARPSLRGCSFAKLWAGECPFQRQKGQGVLSDSKNFTVMIIEIVLFPIINTSYHYSGFVECWYQFIIPKLNKIIELSQYYIGYMGCISEIFVGELAHVSCKFV